MEMRECTQERSNKLRKFSVHATHRIREGVLKITDLRNSWKLKYLLSRASQ